MKNLLPLLLLLFISCNSNPNQQLKTEIASLKEQLVKAESALEIPPDETAFIHTVFFWMKEGVSEEQKMDFARKGLKSLSTISTVYKCYIGPPANTEERGVVDNSYDFALICHFKTPAGQDSYQTDPIHLQFIEDYKHLWERVRVYDNLLLN